MVTATIKCTIEFIADAQRHFERTLRPAVGRFTPWIACVLFGIPLIYWGFSENQWGIGFTGVIFFVVTPYALWMFKRRQRQSWLKSPFLNDVLVMEFNESALHTTSTLTDGTVNWAVFKKVAHFKDGFLLLQEANAFHWIPVTALADASQVLELEGLLRSKIAEHIVIEPLAVRQSP